MIPAVALGILAVAAPPAAAADPRPAIVELTLSGRVRAALERVDAELVADPALARSRGLGLLRGELLERLGRYREATGAYASALGHPSGLEPWVRLRLATLQQQLGHPEVAAGILATLLAEDPPDELVRPAMELLHRALESGGDCRLLGGVRRDRLASSERRIFDLIQSECWLKEGRREEASGLLRDLLAADLDDALAWETAARLGELPAAREPATARLVGLAAYEHREFTAALRHLTLGAASNRWFDPGARRVAYAVARSLFWLGRYGEATRRFRDLAEAPSLPSLRADAYCQLGRSLELAGRLTEARAAFASSYDMDPSGDWAGTSLLGLLRLASLQGDDAAARDALARLAGGRNLGSATARGALFLAVSDIQRGQLGSVRSRLNLADRTGRADPVEISYWRGRLAEAQGDGAGAIERYLEVLQRRPYHPLAGAARHRLAQPALAAVRTRRARELASGGDPRSLHAAELLLGGSPEGLRARFQGLQELSRRRSTAAWVEWSPVPVAQWPVWEDDRRRPSDLLVGLGLLGERGSSLGRHFPSSDLRLSLTAAAILTADERTVRQGLSIAETQFRRRPDEVPYDWVAPEVRRLLHPFPWQAQIRVQAGAFGVDPALLAAVIREESRFDPEAISPAAARGLTQFTLPTAQRLLRASRLGDRLGPDDLFSPAVAIPLGAAYLAELGRRFAGAEAVLVAAYNAGEDQAALWRRTCVGADPEEYLAKIGFRETKAYVVRVLESRAIYRDLYGPRSR